MPQAASEQHSARPSTRQSKNTYKHTPQLMFLQTITPVGHLQKGSEKPLVLKDKSMLFLLKNQNAYIIFKVQNHF